MEIQEKLKGVIKEAVTALGIEVADFGVEYPADLSHGDFATNVALIVGKKAGKNPREIAEKIKDKIKKPEFIQDIKVDGPGFINFFLSKEFFADTVKEIIKLGDGWGKNEIFVGKNVLVEHSSPNLFKAFHIGHVMNNAIGESITRLAHFSGAKKVTAISYPSDVSLGIGKAVWVLMQDSNFEKFKNIGPTADKVAYLGECYVKGTKEYEDNPGIQIRIREIASNLYENKIKTPEYRVYDDAKEWNLAYFKAITSTLGSRFNDSNLIYESEAGEKGKKIVEDNVGTVFTKSEGAIVYKGEADGLHTRVFINSDGYPTYEAKEIGLLFLKHSKYKPDISISITDHEQTAYFKVVIAAAKKIKTLQEIGEHSIHRTHGRMSLKGAKMSSRLGGVPSAESLFNFLYEELWKRSPELVNENEAHNLRYIAVAALKFPILRATAGKNIDFDPETSLSFEGGTGPYLQYSAVRAASLLGKAEKIKSSPKLPKEWRTTPLEKYLSRFPEIVRRSIEEWEPHHVAGYLLELAQTFNSWYGNTKIIDANDLSSSYKLALTDAFCITMTNGLYLLGMQVPEKM